MSKNWSAYQQNIFSFVESGTGNAVVEAVAGSGKSTTIVEAMSRIPQGASTLFLAFNKAIADELKARGVNARTFHSLTYSPVTRHKGVRSVETNKLRILCKENMNGNDEFIYGAFCQRLVGLAKQVGIGCLVPDVEQSWVELADYHDVEVESEKGTFARGIELARELLVWSNNSEMVDFDDMLYIPVLEGLSLAKFDFIFVDEAQDTNAIQRALLRKIMKPTSRMIAVGDPAQAIYGFRGADSDSLSLIAREFRCTKLPLTVTYRCATSIVRYAQQWVNHIEAAPGAVEGAVVDVGAEWNTSSFAPNDLVVCRTTAPLITLAYRFLRDRIPARIMGREIGQGLKTLIDKMKAASPEDLEVKLDKWRERECEKALAKQNDGKIQAIQDKADAILTLMDALPEDERTIDTLLRTIDDLFGEARDTVVLATIHKSKGLEADRVFWLNRSKCPSPWARQAWQRQQEDNLCYVAATRAKTALLLIEEKK